MSTATDIITESLYEIGAASVISPPPAEAIAIGLGKLNSMLELWLSKNIHIGTTPIEVAGEELNEPLDCRNAIIMNLAIIMAPTYSNGKQIVTPDLRAQATTGFESVMRLYGTSTIPKKGLSSTTPVGSGNNQGNANGFYGGTFVNSGNKVDN